MLGGKNNRKERRSRRKNEAQCCCQCCSYLQLKCPSSFVCPNSLSAPLCLPYSPTPPSPFSLSFSRSVSPSHFYYLFQSSRHQTSACGGLFSVTVLSSPHLAFIYAFIYLHLFFLPLFFIFLLFHHILGQCLLLSILAPSLPALSDDARESAVSLVMLCNHHRHTGGHMHVGVGGGTSWESSTGWGGEAEDESFLFGGQ